MTIRKTIPSVTALATALAFAAPARANDVPAAQALFDTGRKLMAQRHYSEACPKFEESERLDPALGTMLNLADCYEKEGKVATAWSTFLELVAKADAAGQKARAQIARERAAALGPRLPKVVVTAPPTADRAHFQITRDGIVVGEAQWGTEIPADPGEHTIAATAPGRRPWSTTVSLTEGHTSTVTVPDLAPAPEAAVAVVPPSSSSSKPHDVFGEPAPHTASSSGGGLGTQRTIALIVAGAGVVGLGVGTAFGLMSISKHSDANTACNASLSACPDANGQALWADAVNAGNISTVAFVAGGVAVAAGAVLWLTGGHHDETESKPGVQVGLGLGSVRLRGTW